jgi:pyruvate/2-oxoglutarate dehydrogenase complex dihydrolipoamide dehydrogenase (E3) component
MSEILRPDICILGGGAGGISLAAEATSCGLSVVLVEKDRVGGDRTAEEIPTNALLAASRFAATLRAAERFGADVLEPGVDYAAVRAHIAAASAELAPNYAQERLEAMKVKIIVAPGRFTRRDTLEAGGATIKARHFVVATGAAAKSTSIPGLNLIRPLTYAALCRLDHPPRRLIVAGADPQGLALAQAMRRLGGEVIILAAAKIFALEDDELVEPIRVEFARDGVGVHEHVQILKVEPHGEGVRVLLARAGSAPQTEMKMIEGSHLLLAADRVPLVEGLGLAAARVRYDAAGIKVGASLRTSNRRIYAIGSVARVARSTGAGECHASRALAQILRGPLGFFAGFAPAPTLAEVMWTDPAIAVAGLTEAEARRRRGRIGVLRWPFAETDRARIDGVAAGHVKLITTRGGKILGAGIVGPGAGELINLCTLAISRGMTAADLASIMVPYPALSDAPRRAGMAFRRGGGPIMRYFLRFLRSLK